MKIRIVLFLRFFLSVLRSIKRVCVDGYVFNSELRYVLCSGDRLNNGDSLTIIRCKLK